MPQEVRTPNIGDFKDVEVIEVLVRAGDVIKPEDPILTLESDKATMDIPSPAAGTIKELKVRTGDRISEGDLLLILEEDREQPAAAAAKPVTPTAPAASPSAAGVKSASAESGVDVVVLGSGPGGYTAAFRAADLGLQVVLVERFAEIGGVCLNVGCIPSKALLHAAKVISDSREAEVFGIDFGAPIINVAKLRAWKEKIIGQLTGGLKGMAKQRKVDIVRGTGKFVSPHELEVEDGSQTKRIAFKHAIIAAGSRPVSLPFLPDDPRIIDSTGALALKDIPKRLLVVGGGIIGLEMATVYHELGSRITVVEMLDNLVAGADPDLVRPLLKRIQGQYQGIYLGTRVTAVQADPQGLTVSFAGDKAPGSDVFDAILVAVGRKPNGRDIGAEQAGINVDEQGFIAVDNQQRTSVAHIFAIGDIVGQPMLAHKASHEGKVAAEVIAGLKSALDTHIIPSVAYTDPEVAWVGMTETRAREQGIKYGKGVFPWAASGRSLSLGRSEGMTKLLFDDNTKQIIGAGIVGPNAGDLIAEAALAIEMGCDAEDIGLTIHPHPTLSETVAMAAEAFAGTITDLYLPKKSGK